MQHASENLRQDLRSFIIRKFGYPELADDQDIFALGFVNSLFAMELVLFIEKYCDTQIPNEELEIANFRSVDAMLALVGRVTSVPADA